MVMNMSNRYAIIENYFVTNVAVADEAYAAQQGWIACPEYVGPGWNYVDGQFIAPIIELKPQPEAPTLEQLLGQANQLQTQIAALMAQNGA